MCRFSLIISFWLLGICVLEASSYIKSAQGILNQLGYSAGSVDGVAGEKTYKAIKRFYTDENNQARYETKEEAMKLDEKLVNAWVGHPHFNIIDNKIRLHQVLLYYICM